MHGRPFVRLVGVTLAALATASGTAAGQSDAGGVLASVRGHARVITETCCGGAAPAPGRECSVTQPYQGEIVARRGRRNSGRIATRTHAGADGAFALMLRPGTYCLVGDDKAGGADARPAVGAATQYTDAACLRAHMARCDAVVMVPGAAPIAMQFAHTCFGPCYRGPMPP